MSALWRTLWRNLLRSPPNAPAQPRRLALLHRDCGSCNGCEIELRLLAAAYDAAAHGLVFVASPQHADALLVTGPVSRNTEAALGAAWDAMPDPRRVVALGDCAVDGGVFKGSYAVSGGAGSVVPVDLAIRGCPPTPAQMLEALSVFAKSG
ncbi:MAG: hydrogenase [Alphaproteobacteria bacterium]|nr:hydrogenase [Alphaproteobacteria bacterium]